MANLVPLLDFRYRGSCACSRMWWENICENLLGGQTVFSSLGSLLIGQDSVQKGHLQRGHLTLSWAQATYLPPLLCNLTSNKNILHICAPQTNRLGFLASLTYPCVSHTVWSDFSAVITLVILSLCGPTKAVHSDHLLFHLQVFETVKSQLPEVLVPLTEYVCMTPEWKLWPTKSRLYVGMKGIFFNKLEIKLWTALELCLFLNFKICWYALNCSCRSLSFCYLKITNVFLKLLCNLLSVLMQNCHICKLHVCLVFF